MCHRGCNFWNSMKYIYRPILILSYNPTIWKPIRVAFLGKPGQNQAQWKPIGQLVLLPSSSRHLEYGLRDTQEGFLFSLVLFCGPSVFGVISRGMVNDWMSCDSVYDEREKKWRERNFLMHSKGRGCGKFGSDFFGSKQKRLI